MSMPLKRFPRRQEVDYPQFRQNIRSGDLLFCSGSAWISRMIQRVTDSAWSHVGFVMRLDAIDRVMVLESVESQGVRTVPLSKYLNDYDNEGNAYRGGVAVARHSHFAAKATAATLRQFGQFAVKLFGYPYDRHEVAKIAARIAASRLPFSRTEKSGLRRDREFICSEYVWECYRDVGIRIAYDRRGFIAPADFARADEVQLLAVLRQKP